MSVQTTTAKNQAIRYGDRDRKASLARQRKNATHNPAETAGALVKIIRDRLTTGQPLGAGYFRNLPDDTWAKLVTLLTPEELNAMHEACDAHAHNPVDTICDDVPTAPPATQPSHAPSWRDHEPPIVHSQYRGARIGIDNGGLTLHSSPPPIKGRIFAISASQK
jgi:hypothetical protein